MKDLSMLECLLTLYQSGAIPMEVTWALARLKSLDFVEELPGQDNRGGIFHVTLKGENRLLNIESILRCSS